MRVIVLFTVSVLVLSIILISNVYPEKTGIIEGKITDLNSNPLSNAVITVVETGQNTKSDTQGEYRITNIVTGTYTVKCVLKGYKINEVIKVKVQDKCTLDFKLKPGTGKEISTGKKKLIRADDIEKKNKSVSDKSNHRTATAEISLREASGVNRMYASQNIDGVLKKEGIFKGDIRKQYYVPEKFNTEEYGKITENVFKSVRDNPLSTFSIDVDAASYSNIRRFINDNRLPYRDAVRIEEMINYFSYDYPAPQNDDPFSVFTEVSECPWNNKHQLVHIGLKGKSLSKEETAASNFVFLIDVSGSMRPANKLPLLKRSFKLLVDSLSENDRVAIVVYAGAAGLVLPSTSCNNKHTITAALDKLNAGGSTAGGAGIRLAYKTAKENFITKGNNRVILATDGDFNVGVSSTSELTRLVEDKRKDGIFLTVLGFGQGNYKDNRMEQLADNGNGNYYYIDNMLEAKKVFKTDLTGTLFTIAKDVKIQVEFNPENVKAYRLIGYENRMLKKEDFNDDTKDAGEIGAGHTVTALYEIVPPGVDIDIPEVDDLKYSKPEETNENKFKKELLTVKLRYKKPDGDKSILMSKTVTKQDHRFEDASENFKFSAAVAEFGMLLRESKYANNINCKGIIKLAKKSKGEDRFGYRAEFIQLVEKCELIKGYE